MGRGLTDLTAREVGPRPGDERPRRSGRRAWLVLAIAGVAWSLWSAGVGRDELVNPGGWTLLSRFWRAALHPELSAEFLRVTWKASLTTIAFAVLGTALSVAIGLVGGVLVSETWWRRGRPPRGGGQAGVRLGWYAGRGLSGLPRGIHEAVWGLFLVNILGRDPMVGILAIAIPFGAITAKVYAELIDESAQGGHDALRSAGVGRVSALAYAVFPRTLPDLVSYAFYRLECSIRSAVILGMIGAGGLGLELNLTFQSLRYREMWTLIYALVAISALSDQWGAGLRRRASVRRVRVSLVAGAGLVVASFLQLRPDLGRLFTRQTRMLLADIAGASWPPASPADGWTGLFQRSLGTIEMSLLAIAIGGTLAMIAGFVAARGGETAGRRAVAGVARLRALGASPASVFAYATLPLCVARFAAYSLYRREVAVRETVVVGVVGAGGLGRLLEQQRAAFNYRGMLATVIALVAVSVVVELVSAAARRSLR